MYRNFEVKKLEMVKAALGEQMPKKNSRLGSFQCFESFAGR